MNTVFVLIDETHDGDIFIDVCSTKEKAEERGSMFERAPTIKEVTLDNFKLREDGLRLFSVSVYNIPRNAGEQFTAHRYDDDSIESHKDRIDDCGVDDCGNFYTCVLAKDEEDAIAKVKKLRNKFIRAKKCKVQLAEAIQDKKDYLQGLTEEDMKNCGYKTREVPDVIFTKIP